MSVKNIPRSLIAEVSPERNEAPGEILNAPHRHLTFGKEKKILAWSDHSLARYLSFSPLTHSGVLNSLDRPIRCTAGDKKYHF